MGLRPSPKGLVLTDRCHGSARPFSGPADALFRDEIFGKPQMRSLRVLRAKRSRARRRWIVDAGQAPAATPAWTSRGGWLADLERWLLTDEGIAACTRAHLRPSLLLRVAAVLAAHADHRTGRHCAVTNAATATAAGCSARTVTTVRRLLAEAGLAMEVRRGTGSVQAPTALRKPSIWHLVSRKAPVDNAGVFHLPPSRRDRRVTHVGKNSPSGRTRPPRRSQSQQRAPRTPRPLHTQKLAAGVIARSSGLAHVHLGHICDALTRSGLDLDAWSAQQITAALNADMRARGWTWPDRIDRPGAFLAARLRRLPQRPATAPTAPAPAPAPDVDRPTPASAAARAAARAYFQQNRGRCPDGGASHIRHKSVKWYTHQPAGRARQVTQFPRGKA